MCAALAFESRTSTVSLLNPFAGFAPEEHRVEVRRDPLLGDTSVAHPLLREKAGFFGTNDPELLRRLVEESAGACIFCGPRVLEKTARYPEDLVPGGRIAVGEATLLPNLFPLAAFHPIVVLSRAHFLRLGEFTPALLADGFTAAQRFLHAAYGADATAVFTAVNANYLFPAGASIVHPHLQMLVSPLPYTHQARLLAASGAYHAANGSSCFDDLVREERRLDRRYIARRGAWHWLAAYAPQGSNEIQAIHETEGDFGALGEADLRDLAGGVSAVLACYEGLGHLSFNYALLSVRRGAAAPGWRCAFRIVTRQNLSAAYRNDDYFLQKLLQAEIIVTLPEELAPLARGAFAPKEA
jgi:hypothetical protein